MSFLAQPYTGPSAAARGHFPGPPLPDPAPAPPPDVHVHPPLVYLPPTWEYHHEAHPVADAGAPATLAALEELGRAGWELAGVVGDGQAIHYYFKRER